MVHARSNASPALRTRAPHTARQFTHKASPLVFVLDTIGLLRVLNLAQTVPDAGTFVENDAGMPMIACSGSPAAEEGGATDECYRGEFGIWPFRNGVPLSGPGTPAVWTSPQFVDIDNDGDYDLLLCGGIGGNNQVEAPELCRSTELKSSCLQALLARLRRSTPFIP